MAATNTMNAVLALPSLRPHVKYVPVPRRYEDTKPVIVQDITHRRILDMGNEFHRRTLLRCSSEKDQAVKVAEQAIWARAEVIKQEALEKAQQKARAELERTVKKMLKAQEKAVKEEGLRVEGLMQRVALQQVQQEREEGQARLRTAVEDTKKKCHEELLQAVAEARQEEQDSAAKEAARVAKEKQEMFEQAMAEAAEEKAQALSELTTKMEKDCQLAVAKAHHFEQHLAAQRLDDMQKMYEAKLADLNQVLLNMQEELSDTQQTLQQVQIHRSQVANELLETREEFQAFIDKTRPFEAGEAEYLIPPLRTIKIESVQ